jgi:hypothetical protein
MVPFSIGWEQLHVSIVKAEERAEK